VYDGECFWELFELHGVSFIVERLVCLGRLSVRFMYCIVALLVFLARLLIVLMVIIWLVVLSRVIWRWMLLDLVIDLVVGYCFLGSS